ncbi:hypothetical protein D3C80_1176570 [compost metagenome]
MRDRIVGKNRQALEPDRIPPAEFAAHACQIRDQQLRAFVIVDLFVVVERYVLEPLHPQQ